MIPVFCEKSIKLCNLWEEMMKTSGSKGIPAADTFTRLTLEVMCKCGMNLDFDAIRNPDQLGLSKIRAIFEYQRPSRLQALPFFRYLPLKVNMKQRENVKYFQDLVSSLLQKGKEKEMLDENKFNDLLTLLLHTRDSDGNPLSNEVLSAQVATFFLAGHETTGVSLAFISHLLAKHPEIQERARNEVLSILPDSDTPVTLQALDKMDYLTCVIKEALRIHPPVSTLFRKCVNDDMINGYRIPAGTPIGISISALHKLPENWTNPQEFNPDRFLEDENNLLYKYLPFGTGPTKCIGYRFALLEMKTILAMILRRFKFSSIPGYNPTIRTGITQSLHPPLHLILKTVD